MNPEKYNLNLYKGADFVFERRFQENGVYFNPGIVRFKATNKEVSPEDIIYNYSSGESPEYITIDEGDDYLITIRIPAAVTADIMATQLLFQIDTENTKQEIDRRVVGTIQIIDGA